MLPCAAYKGASPASACSEPKFLRERNNPYSTNHCGPVVDLEGEMHIQPTSTQSSQLLFAHNPRPQSTAVPTAPPAFIPVYVVQFHCPALIPVASQAPPDTAIGKFVLHFLFLRWTALAVSILNKLSVPAIFLLQSHQIKSADCCGCVIYPYIRVF